MQTQADHVIARFGGLTALARAVGVGPTIVQGWKERGRIPMQRVRSILKAGAALDPPMDIRELFEGPDGTPHEIPALSLGEDAA